MSTTTVPVGGATSAAGAVAPPVTTGGSSAPAPTTASGVPCDVAPIISENCTGCHRNPTKNAAPMPLLTAADFQAPAHSDPTKKVYQVIPTRLHPMDPMKRMPPPPLDALSTQDDQALNAWLMAGAPAAASSCPVALTEVPTVNMEDPGEMTPVGGGSGGAHITPIEYNDPDMTCYKFQTHAAGDKDAPYMQGPGEQYMNFDFAAPWSGTVYLRASKIANDPNSHVLHHWLLFRLSGPASDGAVTPGSGIHPNATLIHAYGPGASPIYLDPDVGLELDSSGLELEAHLNNSTGTPGGDHSGAEICVTTKKPEKLVDLVWVGTDSIAGTSAQGVCAPRGPFPIHIIAAQPHMHKLGNHMKVVVNRAGGMAETIHDEDFSFDSQIYYIEDVVLNQGDTMTTTCSYSGFATFGQSTSNEMCYFFSLAWPAGALNSGGSLIHGPASCL